MFWSVPSKVPIFHIASLARSGETLLLRCLNRHPNLRIVHNLEETDSPTGLALFDFLRSYRPTSISSRHRLVAPLKLTGQQTLILKQAVWEHPFEFNGIVLVRNPIACYASLRNYDTQINGKTPDENWHINEKKLSRWLKKIDPSLLAGFESRTPIDQFALFYNRRVAGLLNNRNRIFRYCDLVTHPEKTLTQIVGEIGVPFDKSLLESHLDYQANSIGHGRIRLDHPINDQSLLKYTLVLSRKEFDELANRTGEVAQLAGYRLVWGTSGIPSDNNSAREHPKIQKATA